MNLSFKQAEKELRERHNLALAFGPHESASGRPRWFVADASGRVIVEGESWRDVYRYATEQGAEVPA